ncbi:tripartite tricarboxylate transporter permease [Grimontia kaedaensis]|uniref:Tripartite tricarboxylate transporter permease n=1 Tax=Grimontia kaedaensis TaxID=2872157 RepID=A0ABY4X286_9GAMM|nr:tripartite tricarboxylate transporter permease [Grimontia kaedaensis]USH05361.1 tripartite tricarboxylate transporter permease [Grimontia kaedaensis]
MEGEILQSVVSVFSVLNLVAIFVGVAFGIFMGAIPGLTGTMGIALIIPLTYGFSPLTAFCVLLGAYKGCLFGGSIPAILLNTPGSPAAAATVQDGYPLAQKGRGSEAMGMALWASVIADVIATVILVLGAVSLAKLATNFGPPEFATLVLFALLVVAGVSGNSLSKGLITASLGFLFGTVGLDPMVATPRFTFDNVNLMNGISLMAMLIGLFAVSELLIQAENLVEKQTAKQANSKASSSISWFQIRGSLKTICRGSFIGVVLGAIPGLGATPAAFLSYSEAKRKSATPEKFGQGELEGVAAAESANNATCGGALIPLLALGVPGDVTTAVLMGAFLIHGLAPGPALFSEDISLIYSLFVVLFIASLFLPLVGKVAIKLFFQITRIPQSVLLPTIAVFCVVGVYGFNNSTVDLWIMLGFGLLGYVMRKLDFPLAPMMIGFVLEPVGEQAVRQALTLSEGNWLIFVSTPLSVLFLALSVISAVVIFRRNTNKNGV